MKGIAGAQRAAALADQLRGARERSPRHRNEPQSGLGKPLEILPGRFGVLLIELAAPNLDGEGARELRQIQSAETSVSALDLEPGCDPIAGRLWNEQRHRRAGVEVDHQ